MGKSFGTVAAYAKEDPSENVTLKLNVSLVLVLSFQLAFEAEMFY